MRKIALILSFPVFFSFTAFAQNDPVPGDFRTDEASGEWGDFSIWEVYDGTSWVAATALQLPGKENAVYLEENADVVLDSSAVCKDLHIHESAHLSLGEATLEVWGKLRFYMGTALPGSDVVLPDEDPGAWISSASEEGKLRFRGESSRTIIALSSANTSQGLSGYNMEIAFDKDAEAIIEEDFRVGNLTVRSGTFTVNAETLFSGNASVLSGNITIEDSASFNPPSQKVLRATGEPIAAFLLDSLATMTISTSDLVIAAAETNLSGTVIVKEATATDINLPSNGSITGADAVNVYNDLALKGTTTKHLSGDITVNGILTKTDAPFDKNGFEFSYGPNGGLEYAGDIAVLTDDYLFPEINGPTNLIISNPNVSLHADRTIKGQLTLNGGILSLGSASLTLGPDSPPIAGVFSVTNCIAVGGTGTLKKIFTAPGHFYFPIGELNGSDAFTPADITVNSGDFTSDSFLSVNVKDEKYPDDPSTSLINRHWTINSSLGDLNIDGSFQYDEGDPAGNEASVMTYIYGEFIELPLSLCDAANKTLSFYNVDISLPLFYVTGSNSCNVTNDNIAIDPTDYCGSVDIAPIIGTDAQTVNPAKNSYTWQQRFNHGQWENISGAVEKDYDPDLLTVPGFYEFRRTVTTLGCTTPHMSNIFAFTLYPEITNIGIEISGTDAFCLMGTAFDIIGELPEGGDGEFSYQWERKDGNAADFEIIGGNTKDYHEVEELGPGSYSYRRAVISPICGTQYSDTATVEVYAIISNNSIDFVISEYCGIPSEVKLTGSTPEGGSGDYSYQWERRMVGGDGIYQPVGNTKDLIDEDIPSLGHYEYRRIVSSFTCDDEISNVLSIYCYPELGANTIQKEKVVYCSTASGSEIEGSEMTGGDGTYLFRWERSKDEEAYISLDSNTQDYQENDDLVPGNYRYRRIVRSVTCVDTSEVLQIKVLPPVTGNELIEPAQKAYCGIPETIVIDASIPSGGSGDYAYSWERRINESDFVPISSEISLTDTDLTIPGKYEYRRLVTSGACDPVSSDTVTLVIYPALSENTIATAAVTYCTLASGVVIEGSQMTGGDGIYTYIWERNKDGGAFLSVGTEESYVAPEPLTPGTYQYRRTVKSALCSSLSEVLTISVQPPISGNSIDAPEKLVYCGTAEGFTIRGSAPEGGSGIFQYRIERKFNDEEWEIVDEGASSFTEGKLDIPGTYYYRRVVSTDLCEESVSNMVSILVAAPIQLAATITETVNNDHTGAIALEVTGGTPPYTYLWSNTASTKDIVNLDGSDYTVVVTDVNGCQASATYSVPRILGLSDSPYIQSYKRYPNPVRETLYIQATFLKPLHSEVYILNSVGQIVRTLRTNTADKLNLEVDMRPYPNGLYFVKVVVDGEVETWKFINVSNLY